jgi:hypothetical protein
MKAVHYLKTWPPYYQAVVRGDKNFEVRKSDRDYKVGDVLVLQEWCPDKNEYTGSSASCNVKYILHGPAFGIEDGFVVMSI